MPAIQTQAHPMTTTTRTRKPRTFVAAVLTPEQIEAQARRVARSEAYLIAREALIGQALALAEKLAPGRVYTYRSAPEDFTVMFGVTGSSDRCASFRGPGLVELSVDLSCWARIEDTDAFAQPTLRFTPRAYSLSSSDGLEVCEAQGRALIEAAAFGRTLLALTSTAS